MTFFCIFGTHLTITTCFFGFIYQITRRYYPFLDSTNVKEIGANCFPHSFVKFNTGCELQSIATRLKRRVRHDVMLFHEKLDITLIRLVRENPVLYDHNNVKYMDFNAREVAWQKIGDELKRPAADCKVRWINIRDVYRRILKRNLEQGRRTKMYKYENEISFLRPFYKDVTIQNEEFESDDRSIDEGNDECDDGPTDDSSNEPIKKIKIKKEFNLSSVKKKKKKRENFVEAVDPISTSTFNESVPPAEFDSADPIDAFLLSIGATLKTFSPYHLNLAKSKIFSVVQEHDLQQIVQKQHNSDVAPHEIKVSTSEAIYME